MGASGAGEEVLAYHGGALAVARRLAPGAPEPWIDLSTGVNPHAWPVPDLPAEVWTRLPDADALAGLERAAALRYGADPASVVAGPGSQALIQLIAWLAPEGPAAVLAPTYGGHAEAFAAAGVRLSECAALDDLSLARTAIVVNPNNPTGKVISRGDLLAIAEGLDARGGLLIVDEAFADFDGGSESLAACLPAAGAVVLRSFGKTFGLPGLRLGFAVASPEIAPRLRAGLGPWPVGGPAIAIGTTALGASDWLAHAAKRLVVDAARLDQLLTDSGWTVLGGTRLFRLAAHPNAAAHFRTLLAAGILTRPFAAWPERLRFGIPGGETQWRRLAAALR